MIEQGFFELLEHWDGLGVLVRQDAPTGTWIFLAIHDDTLGPATGGCRLKVYDRPEDGLRDALRLSEGMTYKWAAMDFPFGGGKTVLAIPRPLQEDERRGLLLRFGELLNSLGGRYGTGADLGTTSDDMQTIAEVSEYVIGVHGRSDGPMDPRAEREGQMQMQNLTAPEREALSVLGLVAPITKADVKHRYKLLAKSLHPDANGGDKRAEDRLKSVNHAYTTLRDSERLT